MPENSNSDLIWRRCSNVLYPHFGRIQDFEYCSMYLVVPVDSILTNQVTYYRKPDPEYRSGFLTY